MNHNMLKSKDHLKLAFDVFNDVLKDKVDKYDLDDIDKSLLYPVYNQLYPNSSQQPTQADLVDKITDGYQRYLNYKK